MNAKDLSSLDKKILVDVLSDTQYAKEHILGAKNFCVYEIAFLDKIKEAFPNKKEKIILYGYSDETEETQRAKNILESNEYTNIHILSGGIKKWKEDGGQIKKADETNLLNGIYEISLEKSSIEWSGRNIGTRHYGHVGIKEGSLSFKTDDLNAGDITLDMNRIENGDLEDPYEKMLVSHLKSDDFFATVKYPEVQLIFVKMQKNNSLGSLPNYNITAELTIKECTENIYFDAFVHEKDDVIVLDAHFDFDRTRWNVKYGSEKFFAKLGMHIIDDRISIEINCFFEKK